MTKPAHIIPYKGPKTWVSGSVEGGKPARSYEIEPIWDKFAQKYIGKDKNPNHALEINLFNELAFGKGIKAVLAEQKLDEASKDDGRVKTFANRISKICDANAALTIVEKSGYRPLNKALVKAFINQWIELEKANGLYPPVNLDKLKISDPEKAKDIKIRRANLFNSAEGYVITNTIYHLCSSLINARITEAKAKLNNNNLQAHGEELEARALMILRSSLCNYADWKQSGFMNYLDQGLKKLFGRISISSSSEKAKHQRRTSSLDYKGNDGEGLSKLDWFSNPKSQEALASALHLENLERLRELIETEITEEEAVVIKMYFGLNGKSPMNLKEIAVELNLGKHKISRLKDSAINKLQAALLQHEDEEITMPQPITEGTNSKPSKSRYTLLISSTEEEPMPPPNPDTPDCANPNSTLEKQPLAGQEHVVRLEISRIANVAAPTKSESAQKLGKAISLYRDRIIITHRHVTGSSLMDIQGFSEELQSRWSKLHPNDKTGGFSLQTIEAIEKGLMVPSEDKMKVIIRTLREHGAINSVQEQDLRDLHSQASEEARMQKKAAKSSSIKR